MNYFKNFTAKLLLLPILSLLGAILLLLFLVAPQFKLFKDNNLFGRPHKSDKYSKEKNKDYEMFY